MGKCANGLAQTMSKSDHRAIQTLHSCLQERGSLAFPKNYDDFRSLKIGILAGVIARLPDVDPTALRRALANHTRRDGYLLVLIHGPGDRRYDLEGQPASTVTGSVALISDEHLLTEEGMVAGAIKRRGNRMVQQPTNLGAIHLPLFDPVHQFDALKRGAGGAKGLKAEHGPSDSFDRSVILFDHVV